MRNLVGMSTQDVEIFLSWLLTDALLQFHSQDGMVWDRATPVSLVPTSHILPSHLLYRVAATPSHTRGLGTQCPSAFLQTHGIWPVGTTTQGITTHTIVDLHNKHWELHTVNLPPKLTGKGGGGRAKNMTRSTFGRYTYCTQQTGTLTKMYSLSSWFCFTHFFSIRMVA